jgi:hypothetical protein
MRPVPWGALTLTGLALVALGGTWIPRPWAAPALQPLTQGLLGAWTLWRLGSLAHTWADCHCWHHAPRWQLTTANLPLVPTQCWLPRGIRRLGQSWGAWPHAGLFLGRAFRWNAHHTQALALALARDGALPVAPDARGGHPALHAVGRHHEGPLVLPWSDLAGHVLVAGTTRSGKTRCLELLVTEAMRAPGAVVVVDPKGDTDLLARCAWEAERQGRPFALFTPAFPTLSATFNPLETATTPAEVGARVQALMPGGGLARDPFFTEYPLAVLERVAAAQAALGQRWTLEGLAPPTVLRPRMEALLAAYLQHVLGSAGARPTLQGLSADYRRRGMADPVADALLDDLEKPRDHFQKVTANLIPAFRGVVYGERAANSDWLQTRYD